MLPRKDSRVPFLYNEEIEYRAKGFLEQNDALHDKIPVPIAFIIEKNYDIRIKPIDFLKRRYGIDSWITRDLTRIFVDSHSAESQDFLNYILAHEMGHYVMHGDYLKSVEFKNAQEWIEVLEGIQKVSYYEHQADMFSAFVLIPPTGDFGQFVNEEFDRACSTTEDLIKHDERFTLRQIRQSDGFWYEIMKRCAERYEVTDRTVIKRLHLETDMPWFEDFEKARFH